MLALEFSRVFDLIIHVDLFVVVVACQATCSSWFPAVLVCCLCFAACRIVLLLAVIILS
jgi:hypothetical protein